MYAKLHALTAILNYIKMEGVRVATLPSDKLIAIVKNASKTAMQHPPKRLKRGVATIPLPGIDVPFHSRELLEGVPAFRALLTKRLSVESVRRGLRSLIRKYIPNVTATPFDVTREYAQRVYDATESIDLKSSMSEWESRSQAERGFILLIELLAHQFAMPVQWIQTQDVMLQSGAVRFIELGPAPTLCGMLKRTTNDEIYASDPHFKKPRVLWWIKDKKDVLYEMSDAGPEVQSAKIVDAESEDDEESLPDSHSKEDSIAHKSPPPPPPSPQAPITAPTTTHAQLHDRPLSAEHTLRVLLSHKLGISYTDVDASRSIKDLANGRSAVQNEVVAEISAEFGSVPEEAVELPVTRLAQKFTSYDKLGIVCSKMVRALISSKLPSGFTSARIRTLLSSTFSVGPGVADAIILLGTTAALQPSKRLASAPEVERWIAVCAKTFSNVSGMTIGTSAPALTPLSPQNIQGQGTPAIREADVDAMLSLKTLLSAKLDVPFADIKSDSTLKELSAGKSAVQNELLVDIQEEFGSMPENGADIPLQELAKNQFGGYKSPGKVLTSMINKTFERTPCGEISEGCTLLLESSAPSGRLYD